MEPINKTNIVALLAKYRTTHSIELHAYYGRPAHDLGDQLVAQFADLRGDLVSAFDVPAKYNTRAILGEVEQTKTSFSGETVLSAMAEYMEQIVALRDAFKPLIDAAQTKKEAVEKMASAVGDVVKVPPHWHARITVDIAEGATLALGWIVRDDGKNEAIVTAIVERELPQCIFEITGTSRRTFDVGDLLEVVGAPQGVSPSATVITALH